MITSASLVTSMIRRLACRSVARTPQALLHPRLQRLVGRRAHVEQEERGDVALFDATSHVEPRRRRAASAPLDARFDHCVEVEVLAVLEPSHLEIALGRKRWNCRRTSEAVRVAHQRVVEEFARVPAELHLLEMAPARAVVADQIIPLVVVEAGRVRRAAPPAPRGFSASPRPPVRRPPPLAANADHARRFPRCRRLRWNVRSSEWLRLRAAAAALADSGVPGPSRPLPRRRRDRGRALPVGRVLSAPPASLPAPGRVAHRPSLPTTRFAVSANSDHRSSRQPTRSDVVGRHTRAVVDSRRGCGARTRAGRLAGGADKTRPTEVLDLYPPPSRKGRGGTGNGRCRPRSCGGCSSRSHSEDRTFHRRRRRAGIFARICVCASGGGRTNRRGGTAEEIRAARRRGATDPAGFDYDEWDYLIRDNRARWCISRRCSSAGRGRILSRHAMRYADLLPDVRRQFSACVRSAISSARAEDGEDFDFNAVVEARGRAARSPLAVGAALRGSSRRRARRRHVFLLDMSASDRRAAAAEGERRACGVLATDRQARPADHRRHQGSAGDQWRSSRGAR